MLLTHERLLEIYPGIGAELEAVGEWMRGAEATLDLRWESMAGFAELAEGLRATYPKFPKDAARTRAIVRLLRDGAEPRPIFVDEADGFVMEGRHRVVAFHMLGLANVPVVRVRKVEPETTPDADAPRP